MHSRRLRATMLRIQGAMQMLRELIDADSADDCYLAEK